MFRESIALCKELELFGAEIVAIDGSKFLAVNSSQRNYTQRKLEKALKEIDAKIQQYLHALDQNDVPQPGQVTLSAEQAKVDKLKPRQERYQEIKSQLAERGETQLSLTDPESRSMPMGQGSDVAYNVAAFWGE